MIDLVAGAWRASLRPEIGGCLASLEHDGVPVLRRMPSDADDALRSACFPLVPYCNRIAEGRFTFAGREIAIRPNLPPQRHPLHGSGWRRVWQVLRSDEASALLEDDCPAGEWPWAYRAHQHVALDGRGCTFRLLVENRSHGPAPMGLGLHPYFRRSADARVSFEAREMLGIDGAFLPDGTRHPADQLAPWNRGTPLPDVLVDHCFTGWSGRATITDTLGRIDVRGFGTPACHVFASPESDALCIEPVSHTPDALNRAPSEMILLPPGGAAGIAMRIEVGALD